MGKAAWRQADKDLSRIASSVRGGACRYWPQTVGAAAEVEVSGMLAEALAAVASASAAVSSAASSAAAKKSSSATTIISSLVKRTAATTTTTSDDALDKFQDLDQCISDIEAGSDKVFRSILHTRVALLNIHTQTC